MRKTTFLIFGILLTLSLMGQSVANFNATENGYKDVPTQKDKVKKINTNHSNVLAKDLIYFEGFETSPSPTTGELPTGWVQKRTTTLNDLPTVDATTPKWFRLDLINYPGFGGDVSGYVHSGNASLATGYTTPNFTWAISPEISIPDSSSNPITLEFWTWYTNNYANYWLTNYYVKVFADGVWTLVHSQIGEYDPSTNEWDYPTMVDMTSFAGKTIKLAFVYEYTDGYQMMIDDISIYQPASYSVTFNVDMTNASGFNPTSDIVYVTGSMLGWAMPGTDVTNQTMERVGNSMIWTKTISMLEGYYEYKYFKNFGWEYGEWPGDPNRIFTVNNDLVINDVWAVYTAPEAKILTFDFIEDVVDYVYIDNYYHSIYVSVSAGTDVFNLTPTMTISEGATINYVFPTTMDFSNPVQFTVTSADQMLQNTYNVFVEQQFQYPEITPDYQFFSLSDPADVDFNIVWGSETEISYVTYYSWDGNQSEIPLVPGVDYFVNDSILTISSDFILSLDPELFSWLDFSVIFGSGYYDWFGIVVVQSTTPYLDPDAVTYDLTNPGDVYTSIVYTTASEVADVANGGNMLVEGDDYHVEGSWLFIHDTYLSELLVDVDDEIVITVTFDTDDQATLTITAVESGIINATINPTSVTYVNDMPDYQDITITWNDASEVTQLLVTVDFGWGLEQFEWPNYIITDNGDGTAILRIFFGDDDKELLSRIMDKEEEYTYVTIEISFDLGAPAYFFMTIIEEYFQVTVTIDPMYAGWVNGNWTYSPGEEVWLEAYPNWGYSFSHWENAQGQVVSTANPYIFTMPSYDVELVAKFVESEFFTVNYQVVGYNGDLYAMANYSYIYPGSQVPGGLNIEFYAYPNWGYAVKEWTLNGNVIDGYTSDTYIYYNLQGNINVTVEFMPYNYPSIEPDYQFFSLSEPQDVDFYINWGSETEISSVYYYYWDDSKESQVELQEGIDYFVDENVLTIASDFILAQSPESMDYMDFSAEFGTGYSTWFGVVVLQSFIPYLDPSFGLYDLTNPGDVFSSIFFNFATEVVSITESGNTLVEGEDYHIDGTWLFIHNSYLSEMLLEVDDEITLTLTFDTDDQFDFTITAIESGIINATIDPTSVTYVNDMPYYQDITVTWNDASAVTQLLVTVNYGWGSEEFVWPYYDVTDHGDGTALLRIYFDEPDSKLMASIASKDEETMYAIIKISFNIGAPAYFYMTIIESYYQVIATVSPEYSGWVYGAYEYSPGEEVYLYAEPSYGYQFLNWRIDGAVVSSQNPYIFIMPEHDVYITAHFMQQGTPTYTVTLTANPSNAGQVVGSGQYEENDGVTIIAVANEGYQFIKWTTTDGTQVSTDASFSFPMPAQNVAFVANFEVYVTFSVTFNVDMTNATNFDPQSDIVYITGSMLGWAEPGTNAANQTMTRVASSWIWTKTMQIEAGTYEYKYFRNAGWDGGEWAGGDNRVVVVTNNMTVNDTWGPDAVDTESISNVQAYPNPFSNQLTISNAERVTRVVITNIIGQVVMDIPFSSSQSTIETGNLNNGIYLITFQTNTGERVVRKMIKK